MAHVLRKVYSMWNLFGCQIKVFCGVVGLREMWSGLGISSQFLVESETFNVTPHLTRNSLLSLLPYSLKQ